MMLNNLKQIHNYVEAYCSESPQLKWCETEQLEFSSEISMMQEELENMSKSTSKLDEEKILDMCLRMHNFANVKYKVFQKLWTEFDVFAVVMAICFAFWLFMHFVLYGVLDLSIQLSMASVGILTFFYLNLFFDFHVLFGSSKATCIVMLLVCFFMIEIDVTQCL